MKPPPTPEQRAQRAISIFQINHTIRAELLERIAQEIREAQDHIWRTNELAP